MACTKEGKEHLAIIDKYWEDNKGEGCVTCYDTIRSLDQLFKRTATRNYHLNKELNSKEAEIAHLKAQVESLSAARTAVGKNNARFKEWLRIQDGLPKVIDLTKTERVSRATQTTVEKVDSCDGPEPNTHVKLRKVQKVRMIVEQEVILDHMPIEVTPTDIKTAWIRAKSKGNPLNSDGVIHIAEDGDELPIEKKCSLKSVRDRLEQSCRELISKKMH